MDVDFTEYVGQDGEEAAKQIREKYPKAFKKVVVISDKKPVTKDFRRERVRVFVNDEGVVSKKPMIG